MDPERETSKGIQSVCPLIIVQEAATIPPPSTLIFRRLWRLPFPRPIELDGGVAVGRKVTDMLHIGVVLKIWVGMEFPCYQVIQLFCIRCMGECEPSETGIDRFRPRGSNTIYG